MQQISQNIILGIVAGLTTTIISLIISDFWKKRFIPWLEERIYKDAKIEGRWYAVIAYHDCDFGKYYFDLYRNSHKISGTMTSKNSGKIFYCHGEFRNMILTLNYESKDQREVDRGGFTFLLVKNGQELDGCAAYYYNPDHKIETGKIILARSDNFELIAEQLRSVDSKLTDSK
jgi:hypothetical protein